MGKSINDSWIRMDWTKNILNLRNEVFTAEDKDYLEDFYASLLTEDMGNFDEDRYLERMDRMG